jgi:DNA-binding NtrC family response regulator
LAYADDAPSPPSPDATLEEVTRRHIEAVLRREGGHVAKAAKTLGMPRSTLYQKIKQLGLETQSD